jgi:hypothetical protein
MRRFDARRRSGAAALDRVRVGGCAKATASGGGLRRRGCAAALGDPAARVTVVLCCSSSGGGVGVVMTKASNDALLEVGRQRPVEPRRVLARVVASYLETIQRRLSPLLRTHAQPLMTNGVAAKAQTALVTALSCQPAQASCRSCLLATEVARPVQVSAASRVVSALTTTA